MQILDIDVIVKFMTTHAAGDRKYTRDKQSAI